MQTKKTTAGGNTDLLQLMLNAENLDITEEQKKENEEFGATYEKGSKEGEVIEANCADNFSRNYTNLFKITTKLGVITKEI